MHTVKHSKNNHVPGIHRAIDVLEFIASAQREVSFSELLERLDIPRQSLIRTLNTLCDRGFLHKSPQRGLYRVGLKFIYMGHGLADKYEVRTAAWKHMKDLSLKTHKTIELSTLDKDQLILLEQIPGTEEISLYSRVGSVIPYLHSVSVGKVYLALMDAEKRTRVLNKIGLPAVTKYTITDFKTLEQDIARTRQRGYGFEDQELRTGIRRVAAPVYNDQERLVGCIGLSAPIFSFDLNDVDTYGQLVREAGEKSSVDLGYTSQTIGEKGDANV